MAITTLSSREFQRNLSRAKKATNDGPVFITDQGRPAHVLLSIEEYRRLAATRQKIGDLLAMPGGEDSEFTAPNLRDLAVAAKLS
jgi:prevent-host-death family protein